MGNLENCKQNVNNNSRIGTGRRTKENNYSSKQKNTFEVAGKCHFLRKQFYGNLRSICSQL